MLALHGRKVLLTAMLAAALSAPALAGDTATTAQQTTVGRSTTEMAPRQDNPVGVNPVVANPIVVKESFATVTNGPLAAPRARPPQVAAPRPLVSSARHQPSAAEYYRAPAAPSLILGIRH
jgi:hypothetical protein